MKRDFVPFGEQRMGYGGDLYRQWETIVPHFIVVRNDLCHCRSQARNGVGRPPGYQIEEQNELFHLVMARRYEIGVN